MSELSLKGTLVKDFGTIEVSDKFKKREFVISTGGDYPQEVKFQLVQDKTDYLDNYKQGEALTVHFNIRGNQWKDNWFVNLDAWRLEKEKGNTNSEAVQNVQNAAVSNDQTPQPDEDNLPF